jgi:hypothetical protein
VLIVERRGCRWYPWVYALKATWNYLLIFFRDSEEVRSRNTPDDSSNIDLPRALLFESQICSLLEQKLSPLFWLQLLDVLGVIYLLKATEDLTCSMKLEVVIQFWMFLNQVEDQLNAFNRTKGCDGLRPHSTWCFKKAEVLISRTV